MSAILSLISKIHEKGNRFIIEELKNNGVEGLVPSHGDILVCLYKNNKMTMKDIANCIHRTKPTVTVLVDKLEKLEYLKREFELCTASRRTFDILSKATKVKDIFISFSNIDFQIPRFCYSICLNN